jgi:hypothetical protein
MGYGSNPYGILEVSDDCVKFSDRGVSGIFASCEGGCAWCLPSSASCATPRRSCAICGVRPLLGPAPHEVVWRVADSARVVQILKNSAYAGAYVYGRRRGTRCADNLAVSGSG